MALHFIFSAATPNMEPTWRVKSGRNIRLHISQGHDHWRMLADFSVEALKGLFQCSRLKQ